jgi:hypothetical protein
MGKRRRDRMNTLQNEFNKCLVHNALYAVQQCVSRDLDIAVMMSINNMIVSLMKFTTISEIDELEERKHGT